jgi:hypothetical protein
LFFLIISFVYACHICWLVFWAASTVISACTPVILTDIYLVFLNYSKQIMGYVPQLGQTYPKSFQLVTRESTLYRRVTTLQNTSPSPLVCGCRTSGRDTGKVDLREHACYLLQAGYLLALFFDPEDGGDMFLRNAGDFQRTTLHYISKCRTPINHCYENLKTCEGVLLAVSWHRQLRNQ